MGASQVQQAVLTVLYCHHFPFESAGSLCDVFPNFRKRTWRGHDHNAPFEPLASERYSFAVWWGFLETIRHGAFLPWVALSTARSRREILSAKSRRCGRNRFGWVRRPA